MMPNPGWPRPRWADMTTRDFAALDTRRVIAVLPVGAIEQHGPHLPVGVDAYVAQGIMLVATVSYWGVGLPDLFPAIESRHGIHGGSSETSIMLHLHPGLVRDAERRDFVPASVAMEQSFTHLRPEGAGIGFGWQAQDLQPEGACGNALDADAARGAALVARAADGVIELLREVDRFDLAALAAGPKGAPAHGAELANLGPQ